MPKTTADDKARFEVENVPIEELEPFPRNYRHHPEEQLAHLRASLNQFGWYRNVVVASDNVILAGHGIVEAARQAGETEVPVYRVEFPSTDPRAMKLAIVDNEVSRIAEDDERALAEMLGELVHDSGLEGTGWTDEDLNALLAEFTVPQFEPISADEQGRLDELAPKWMTCPNCGETFDAREAGQA